MSVRRATRTAAMVLLVCLLAPAYAGSPVTVASAQAPAGEQGRFVLHKFEQAIGEETYTIATTGDTRELRATFRFVDRSTEVPLTAQLRVRDDWTPVSFDIKGRVSRFSQIDTSVRVQDRRVEVREGDRTSSLDAPAQFFTVGGYAPVSVQLLLLRYWRAHGSPEYLDVFPAARVRIVRRGSDRVDVEGRQLELIRYSVSGLNWGTETLWLDAEGNLAALVTVDAEFDHFEAVRPELAGAIPFLVEQMARDQMAGMVEKAAEFSVRSSGPIAITGGTLIDGTGRPPVDDAIVVVENGRITAAGPRLRVPVPLNATIVDGRGKTILPGLWDMHAHFGQVEWGPVYLAAGVTTVRDVGNELEYITAVRDAIRARQGVGPRLLLAGVVDGSGPARLGVQRVDTPAEAAAWVDRYHGAGFEQMKIYSSITQPNLREVARAAHRDGMKVTGHVPEGMDGYAAVRAGLDQINHLEYVAEMMVEGPEPDDRTARIARIAGIDVSSPRAQEAIKFLKDRRTVVDPTIALYEALIASTPDRPLSSFEPGARKLPAPLARIFADPTGPTDPGAAAAQRMVDKYVEIVGALQRAGVTIVAGTDQTIPGHSLYRELELYVRAGMTPMQAIRAATAVPAQVMGLAKESGTIERGKRADVIVLGRNPLQSISNVRSVEKVVANGVLYDSATMWQSVGFAP